MAAEFHIFLSAVTGEFGLARNALAADLRSRDTFVRVQSDFRQEAESDTTLKKLHDYIRDCSAVVCVIGKRSGACPPPAAAAPFLDKLPPDIREASYTQWEFFFARYYRRRLSIYIANADYVPDQPTATGEERPELQRDFVRHIVEEKGLDRSYFSNIDQLARAVLKEDWPKKEPVKPIVLPYASLGSRFKGREAFLHLLRESLTREDGGATAIVSRALSGMGGIGGRRSNTPRPAAEELGQLALALEQAAATIDKLRYGIRRYLEIWRDNRQRVVGWARPEITGYHHAVAATWQTSVDQLSEAGRHLLERLAFLAPDPVPMFLLAVAVPDAETEDLHEALTDLSSVSLARWEIEREQFAVHRLVQDVTRRSLDAAASRRRVTEALGWVNAAFTGDPADVRAWSRLDPLAKHALSATQGADGAEIVEPTARLMNQLGILLATKSLHAQAEPLYRRALAIDKASLGPDHPTVAIRLNNLALLLQATNRLAEAEPLMRRALAIHEASFGPDQPTVARYLNNLAGLLGQTNRPAEAEPLYRRALAIGEASFGPDHPTVAGLLNNLAALLKDTNRLAEAEPLYRRALAISEASFGPNHPEVARNLNNFALLLQATKRLSEAEPLYRRALAISEASFGPDHPTVAIRLNNLAELLRATNRLTEAEPLYRRALAIDEASFGPDHPEFATHLNNLALLLQAANMPAEAEPLMRRVLAILIDFEGKTGHPHPHRDAVFRNYARLLAAMGKSQAEIEAAITSLTGCGGA